MPSKPFGAEIIADQVRLPKDVTAEASETRRIKDGFEFRQQRFRFEVEGTGFCLVACAIQFIRHERFRRRGPARATSEIFFDQPSVRTKFKIAGALSHWRLDDFISDHQ